ncbi:hypothetical protein Prudu_521S000300 [Prunus dulcis]|uniref:Uncharacterized protein n=1 Tax=Prunus dulcis TaxID=3755 RepID=A0A5H2Y259_PRUDU|nr:hypothetical protein Prudu_521S000300 [Prunus dulcis]
MGPLSGVSTDPICGVCCTGVSRGVSYLALRQAPYVALVVPNYVRLDFSVRVRRQPKVETLRNVQFTGETLSKF